MKEKKVKDCKLIKAVSVDENDSVVDVAKKLHHFQERRILVLNKKKFPIGIISIVDINDRVVARNKSFKTKAKDIMSYPLHLVADVETPLKQVLKKMISKDNYYIPVVKKGALQGFLTYSNISKVLHNDKRKKS